MGGGSRHADHACRIRVTDRFCWQDEAPDAAHYATLVDAHGAEVLRVHLFKVRRLSLPPFASGRGSLPIRIGARCFTDDVHACAASASGRTLKRE